jgi:8-oxo-dGTP diphosphatase
MDRREHGMTQAEIDAYQERWGKGPHVAADLVVVSIPWDRPDPAAHVLLIRRAHGPFQGAFALPGGFVEMDEDLEAAARRELSEETGLEAAGWVEQLQTYGRPGRDPRARVVSVVQLAMVPWHELKQAQAGDDASEARFVRLQRAEAFDEQGSRIVMAFDHDLALQQARSRLRTLGSFSSAPMLLLVPEFTLMQAHRVYELVLERSIDASAFEAWLQRQGWLELVEGPNGRADRYRLRSRKPAWMDPGW